MQRWHRVKTEPNARKALIVFVPMVAIGIIAIMFGKGCDICLWAMDMLERWYKK